MPSFDNNITVVPIDEEEDAGDTVGENCMAAAYWRLEFFHSEHEMMKKDPVYKGSHNVKERHKREQEVMELENSQTCFLIMRQRMQVIAQTENDYCAYKCPVSKPLDEIHWTPIDADVECISH